MGITAKPYGKYQSLMRKLVINQESKKSEVKKNDKGRKAEN